VSRQSENASVSGRTAGIAIAVAVVLGIGGFLLSKACSPPPTPPATATPNASPTVTVTPPGPPSATATPRASATATPAAAVSPEPGMPTAGSGGLLTPVPAGSCRASVLPDPACTPGAMNPAVTPATIAVTICTRGWTATIRPPVSVTQPIKLERMRAYGVSEETAYELDHLIPLELGGAPRDLRNLWPEPWNGPENAHVKDATENAAKAAVCAGTLLLADAQTQIAADWPGLCTRLHADPTC
jgi:hypothetical protein